MKPAPTPPKLPSLAEELDRELKEIKTIQAPPIVKLPDAVQTKPMFRDQQQATPSVIASAPKVKTPETVLKVAGTATGSNPYLARVKARIM